MLCHIASNFNLFLYFTAAILTATACSNSEIENCTGWDNISVSQNSNGSVDSSKSDYLPLDDSEYPYAGIPRIVIETENYREIKDRETEVPAKLQIWGERVPESEIMNLTIRGRGNQTWAYPKKPYAIQFEKKQAFLGMSNAKKWVMLANYRDRTLIRNAVAFELARKTSLEWTPSGKFVDVFLNRKFIGNYYICEKIEIKKNRLELEEKSFLLELDTYYDEENKFRTKYNNFPINIKHPKQVDSVQFNSIKDYVNSAEQTLQLDAADSSYLDFINQESFADYFIVYALSTNDELFHPKSVFIHKSPNGKLCAGPVWDFDYATFDINKIGLTNRNTKLFSQFLRKKSFKEHFRKRWKQNRDSFLTIESFIDSLSDLTRKSNELNAKIWPIKIDVHKVGDEDKSFYEAIDMLKEAVLLKITEMDSLIYTF